MADVFISYSRRDKDFVKRLFEALEAHDRDAWVDWEDIPPTVEWLAEIYAAIEAADTFVFVISPDSTVSEVCGMEIAHAVKHNKRLVPIVCHDVDAKAVPQALAALNWIFFRESDDFDRALQSLIEALDTNLDWVRAHTRLLERAIEWDNEERDASFVLRGRDLEEAEQWLAQGATKDPQPTALQTQYILASRQDATRRQRRTLVAAVLGLIIVGVAAVVAFYQYRVAEARAKVAFSRELASTAIGQLEVDPELSLLLATEAVETEYTVQAEDALRQALASPWRATLRGHTDRVNSVAYSPDGQWIVTASLDGTARVWDVQSKQQKMVLQGHTGWVTSAAYSPDGRWIVTAGEDGTARVWDAGSGQQMLELQGHTAWVYSAAYSPDGQWIVTASLDGTARVWDAGSGRQKMVLQHAASVTSAAYSPDGRWIVTAGGDRTARVWDAGSGQQKMELKGHRGIVRSAAYSPDGRWIVTAGEDGTARVWDAESGQQKMVLEGHTDWVWSAAYSPDGRWIVTAGLDNTAWVWWWGGGVEDLLAAARSRLGAREFTCQERGQYLHEDLDCGVGE
jgi:hypothetical protein